MQPAIFSRRREEAHAQLSGRSAIPNSARVRLERRPWSSASCRTVWLSSLRTRRRPRRSSIRAAALRLLTHRGIRFHPSVHDVPRRIGPTRPTNFRYPQVGCVRRRDDPGASSIPRRLVSRPCSKLLRARQAFQHRAASHPISAAPGRVRGVPFPPRLHRPEPGPVPSGHACVGRVG